MKLWILTLASLVLTTVVPSSAAVSGPFRISQERPTLDRWMYPFNVYAGSRVVAPTYGSFDPRFDARDAQFLLGWDTASEIPTNAGPSRYLLRRVVVQVTSIAPNSPNQPFVYDPTYDSAFSYVTNQPGFRPDTDPGRPIELYGMGFRGGFTTETFLENSPFGPIRPFTSPDIAIESRNAYAATFDEAGELIDISNHAAQLNAAWTRPTFEVHPWAVGTTTNAAPGEPVPDDAKMRFAVELTDPLVVGYLQSALDQGRLRLVVSCLSPAGQSTTGGTGAGGSGAYPWWATKEHGLYDAPRLELEGVVVGPGDEDADGLPDDWERFYWGAIDAFGALEDADGDGAANGAEWQAGTDPRDAGSVFRITRTWLEPGGILVLQFRFAASRDYAVETASAAAGADWVAAAGSLRFPEPGVAEWRSDSRESVPTPGARLVRVRSVAR